MEKRELEEEYSEEKQIVSFEDESAQSEMPVEAHKPTHPAIQTYKETRDHAITDFLNRPRNVDTIQVLATQTPFTLLASYNVPDVVLSSEMVTCKCADFRYFKATVKFRFTPNANKFSLGQLLIMAEPMPSMTGINANLGSLTSISGYRCCYLDFGTASTVTLEVPFIYINQAYDLLNDGSRPWAAVNVYVLNQLNSTTGSADANVAVWVWCENVELSVPTPQHITPFPPVAYAATRSNGAITESSLTKAGNGDRPYNKFYACSEADAVAKTNSVSGVFKKATSAAKAATSIGGSIGKTIGPALDWMEEAANTLALGGFSKPPNNSTTGPFIQIPGRHWTNFDGSDQSNTLGGSHFNSLSVDPNIFGTPVDEMEIKNIVSQFNFIEQFVWPATAPPGTVLRSWPVAPGFCGSRDTTSVWHTQLSYVASMFNYWHGTIAYKLTFVCNQFYSGRVALVYLPGYSSVGGSLAFEDIEAASKQVIEVRNTTNSVYNVPWNMAVPWLDVDVASRTSTGTNFTYNELCNLNNSTGMVALVVINALVHPDNVPSSIPVNLFIAGGEDIAFAVPNSSVYVRYYPSLDLEYEARRRALAQKRKLAGRITPQKDRLYGMSGAAPPAQNMPKNTSPSGAKLLKTTANDMKGIASYSTGEIITSLRPLTRMFSPVWDDTFLANQSIQIDPAYFAWSVDDPFLSRLEAISSLFAFWRGSIRFKLVPRLSAAASLPVIAVYTINLQATNIPADYDNTAPADSASNIGFQYYQNLDQTPFVEIAIPWYSRRYLSVVSELLANSRLGVRIAFLTGQAPPATIFKAAGDDFSFGCLIGAPAGKKYS
jgi:hypothetical protein